jgi:hypothetical protein
VVAVAEVAEVAVVAEVVDVGSSCWPSGKLFPTRNMKTTSRCDDRKLRTSTGFSFLACSAAWLHFFELGNYPTLA